MIFSSFLATIALDRREWGLQCCQPEEADQLQHLIHLSHLDSSHGRVHHLTLSLPVQQSHCTKRCPVLLAVVRERWLRGVSLSRFLCRWAAITALQHYNTPHCWYVPCVKCKALKLSHTRSKTGCPPPHLLWPASVSWWGKVMISWEQ